MTVSDTEDWEQYDGYECERCHGRGEIDYGDDVTHDWIACPECHGQGMLY